MRAAVMAKASDAKNWASSALRGLSFTAATGTITSACAYTKPMFLSLHTSKYCCSSAVCCSSGLTRCTQRSPVNESPSVTSPAGTGSKPALEVCANSVETSDRLMQKNNNAKPLCRRIDPLSLLNLRLRCVKKLTNLRYSQNLKFHDPLPSLRARDFFA